MNPTCLPSAYHNYTVKFPLGQPKDWRGSGQGRGDLRVWRLDGVKEIRWEPKP